MSAETAFRIRAKAVRSFLRSLEALEVAHSTPGRGFYRAASAIAASRAAAFIMIYNCVEHATREAIVSIRTDISASRIAFGDVRAHWQEEVVQAHFLDALRQGTNHVGFLKQVIAFIPGRLSWPNSQDELPFNGNVDHVRLLRFVKHVEFKWKPPKKSLGGSDLQLIRQTRNDLAHGDETFEDVGARYKTQDIIDKFERIRAFMVSYLRMLERYRTNQRFRR